MESGQYLGEISALCFLHLPPPSPSLPYLLAGTGSQLLFYDLHTGNMIASFQVFKGVRVHGISCLPLTDTVTDTSLTFRVAVFGERRLKLCLFNIQLPHHNKQTIVHLLSFQSLPNLGHWVLDVCFIQESVILQGSQFLAIGCTDNTLYFWDTLTSTISFQVSSPDRCLLYTMRIWGHRIDSLHVASGTIYNQIIVWKVVDTLPMGSKSKTGEYKAVPVCRLGGHEGSIFRITWSLDGSKLVSVSDDRSARIWEVHTGKRDSDDDTTEVTVSPSTGPVLFGHTARVWDCCMSDSLIITVGEDCTCRVWGLDGTQLRIIKEHIGRGVWRCLYDPSSSLLVTAGFDSAIKVHSCLPMGSELESERCNGLEEYERKQIFTIQIPNSKRTALMDSKSEYVRCMHLASECELYVATNNGFLYLAKISDTGDVAWTQLFCSQEEIPIVCMSVFPGCVENWIALGDGKGRLTVVRIADIQTPELNLSFTWPAEAERQLLGTYWCKSLGHRYIFTADPRGRLKLWKICKTFQSSSEKGTGHANASLVAEFTSCFPTRILCLDASFHEQVLVCGDLRGNLVLFPLLLDAPDASVAHIAPLNYFKGAHGISSVSSVSIHGLNPSTFEIHSTGGDGCICYMEYDGYKQKMEFIGMKQVKELSLVRSLFPNDNEGHNNYAIGFTSADYLIWNLSTETKVAEIPCGGWRRPHTYFLGDVPEMKNCFAFVKDEVIYMHKQWVASSDSRIYPQNLHLQFHGREIHSLCFIVDDATQLSKSSDEKQAQPFQSAFVATGCEDGTVRLTSYSWGIDNWSASKLLGEHVGGSAVRSLCCVFKVHTIVDETLDSDQGTGLLEDEFLLISVGAKRVLTAWKRKASFSSTSRPKTEEALPSSSISFQWLSSDLPTRNRGSKKENLNDVDTTPPPEKIKPQTQVCCSDALENDWRYLAVTAFLVKFSRSRMSVCFIVVSCSDATVTLRALVLPHRLWFDIALLVPSTSPVLSLEHVVVPDLATFKDKSEQMRSLFMVISGSTDGSIGFWDVSEAVEAFMRKVSVLHKEDCNNFQTRPRTGRGSQGGRQWRTLEKTSDNDLGCAASQEKEKEKEKEKEIDMIWPVHVVKNAHQSGVNCLHVSDVRGCESCFSCNVISGGDDQALHSLTFDVMGTDKSCKKDASSYYCLQNKYQIVFSHPHEIASAHCSAVKGVWTDGHWVFSTGLDQRVRCWRVSSVDGKLSEKAHLIVSVPEPEALDVRVCGRNRYQIAVAGRGMQMMEFLAPADS
ncbi:uncharacterized protein LOC111882766 isoform X2 [Lactuca sativa]|uniref:uncharacterized protein LOC111882766 isoform X2 n=1 Tax=Lactuca sativa TaxID=4236 RepID=UPI000CD869AB|nr:uncharacterized protein LOC111882766 isoform X2 [Lactuca sativa]